MAASSTLDDGRGGGAVTAAAHGRQHAGDVQAAAAAAAGHEDAVLHLDQEEAGVAAGQVHDPVGDDAHPLDVLVLTKRREQHRGFGDGQFLGRGQGRGQRLALRRSEHVREPLLDQGGVGPLVHTQRQGLSIPSRGGGEGERPRVLVDAEREDRRLERRHGDASLGDDVDEQRHQRAVVRAHEGLARHARRQLGLVGVVIERDHLHMGSGAQIGEIPEAVGMDGDDRDAIRVESLELADVAVHSPAQADVRLWIELAHRDHGREGVEVGVGVGRDQLGRAHRCQYTRGGRRRPFRL
jgi:hypothetical protein